MGGMWDCVEGPTKLATWLAFKRELRELCDDDGGENDREKTYGGGLYLRFPTNKKEAYRRMVPREDGLGWVLQYHIHS